MMGVHNHHGQLMCCPQGEKIKKNKKKLANKLTLNEK